LILHARHAAKGFHDLPVELNDAAVAVIESMRGYDRAISPTRWLLLYR
jgi:hypothetical protein